MSDYVCEELMVDIFTRLPAKSLLRFRSVSKSLCSCIASPSFIRLHTLRSPQKLLIFHGHDGKEETELKYFYTLHSEDQLPLCSYVGLKEVVSPLAKISFDIVGSCNGILCLSSFNNVVTLWNPSIRRKLTIPDYPYRTFSMGFGFDSITNDYKFVSLSYKRRKRILSSFIYTVKTGTWCEIASPSTVLSYMSRVGCFVNGSLHWIVKHYRKGKDKEGHPCIMTLDLSTHTFGTIELPIATTLLNLIIINGSLALVSSCNNCIWSRRELNNTFSWQVDFKLKKDPYYFGLTRVFQLTPNGCLLLKCPFEGFQAYNPQTKVQSKLANFNVSSHKILMEKCVESLELLDTGTTCEVNRPSSPRA